MAYVIGSANGKKKANEMKTGESWTNPTDGSTWTKQSDGSVSVKTSAGETFNNAYSPTSSGGSSVGSSKNSQYTGVGTHNDASASAWAKNQINYYKEQYNNAIARGDTKAATEAHLAAEAIRERYGYSGGADGSQYIALPDDSFEYTEEKPEYENKYDPQIDALLNEILNREDFSYDAMNDPLYQQYAAIYQREGDRAMKEALAEAAAGAGGMNTYAVTAAQQANSYYNSKLNDIIPQLYQASYEMHLQNIENKVRDLGLLQNMDATQYARYRDTITDWKDDRNFAYGIYQDDVQQGNWEQTFDNNNYWANKEFDFNDFWANKNFNYNDMWANKEWDTNQADKEYDRSQAEQEKAYNLIVDQIGRGVTTFDAEDIAKAGLTQAVVNQMIADHQLKNKKTGGSGGGGGGGSSSSSTKKVTGGDAPKITVGTPGSDGSGNYAAVANACDELASNGDEWAAAAYANEAKEAGIITQKEYNSLIAEYNPALDAILRPNFLNDYSFGWGKN